jgi:hypothetical protein
LTDCAVPILVWALATVEVKRQRKECGEWKHYSRFRTWKDFRCSTTSEIRFSGILRCYSIWRKRIKRRSRLGAAMFAIVLQEHSGRRVPKPFCLLQLTMALRDNFLDFD